MGSKFLSGIRTFLKDSSDFIIEWAVNSLITTALLYAYWLAVILLLALLGL